MQLRAPTASFLIIGALVLAACAGGSPTPEVSPTAGAAADPCPSLELRGPDGTALNLSGTWIAVGDRSVPSRPGTYELNHLNSCLAWVGRSAEEAEDVGASWVNVFIGKVNRDLTITGNWAVVAASETFCAAGGARCDQARGTLTLRIEWVPTAEGNRVRLLLQEYTKIGSAGGLGGFVTSIWVRPGDEALFAVPGE